MPEAGILRKLPFVLVSESPQQRLALLERIAITPVVTVDSSNLNKQPQQNELPATYAMRLAREQAVVVAECYPSLHVLASGTVVACGRRILPATETIADAKRCLDLLSGRRHRVFGGVCLHTPGKKLIMRVITTIVAFKRLDDSERATYLTANEWYGKAGGYTIQGRAAAFIRFIIGSYDNVAGLPLYETAILLKGVGLLN